MFERLLKSEDKATVASRPRAGIGDSYAGEGDQLAAAEYYLTAAYVAPDLDRRAARRCSPPGADLRDRQAGRGRRLAYRKLLAQSDLPSDLAASARQGLAALRR